ncbi:protein disulfide isomerase pTAC5, chloroplastic-like [Coffea arabica]|uniref:Protein disulfide isomerase pTAC5, chloroplastic-like n=1 Tax=Coffea arabica TaxID=13443 RepID=A0A6P6WXI1_COFAR|nr:protein disulfide isomerase pTAC5, chloroplastic-like [Coffea arabica]
MSSTLPLCFKFNQPQSFPYLKQPTFSCIFQYNLTRNTHICFTFSSSNSNSSNPLNYGPQDEARWHREEQRWLREEQRWLREEQRWQAERLALLNEIQRLNLRVQELEQLNSVPETSISETIANIAKLLQVLKEGDLGKSINKIPESRAGALPFGVETAQKVEEMVVKEVVEVPEKENNGNKRATLRMGSEGDDVEAMQEALLKLGFYSGEEDMEFSSFSTGTERAVKTWQASLGAPEDGIMTAELLERLYIEQNRGTPSFTGGKGPEDSSTTNPEENGANGAATASITEISEVKETVVGKDGVTGINMSEHRVFLLGENRWEEPSRLAGRNKQPETKIGSGKTMTKCPSCHGEGRLLCMECDGTGEPNVEPQFLEWVDEGAKCPYCEGLGHTTCDVCEGRKVIEA